MLARHQKQIMHISQRRMWNLNKPKSTKQLEVKINKHVSESVQSPASTAEVARFKDSGDIQLLKAIAMRGFLALC